MPRLARVVVPNVPHHVTQRGNRRQRTFFQDSDYDQYKQLMAAWCSRRQVAVWAYCLMPNHVHLILTPKDPKGLARAVGEAHRRYTLTVNTREGWRGYFWQGRFASFPMDPAHLMNAVRYVLLNPVRAGLARKATDWQHSSARAHLLGSRDRLVDPVPLGDRISEWDDLLRPEGSQLDLEQFHRHERSGRPMGDDQFVRDLETLLGRRLRLQKVGRKPRSLLSKACS